MTHGLRYKRYGHTVEEWIALVPAELEISEVSLWHIVEAGTEGFGLSGEALTDYVRRNVVTLLGAGAVPARFVANAIHGRGWLPVDYGCVPADVADAVIAEWHQRGGQRDWHPWFVLAGNCLKP